MNSPFQPKKLNVPGLMGDDAINESLKQFAAQGNALQAAAPPPSSAVDMADKIQNEYLKAPPPGPSMRGVTAALPGPLGLLANAVGGAGGSDQQQPQGPAPVDAQQRGIDVRSNILSDAAAAIPSPLRDFVLGPLVGELGQGGLVNQLGTLSTPEQRQAEAEKQAVDAAQNVQIAKDTAAARDRMAAVPDDQAEAQGIPRIDIPNSQSMSVPDAAGQKAADAKFLAEREKQNLDAIAATKDPSKQPTQTWWLDAMQAGVKGAAQMGTGGASGVLEYGELLRDASGVGLLTGGGRSNVRAWVDTVDATLNKMLPGDKTRSQDFIHQLAQGGGSMVGFLIAGYAGAAIGMPAGVMAGGLGAVSQGDQQFKDAEKFNATTVQKYIALIAGSAIGASEAIPIDRMFMRAEAATGGLISRMLHSTAAGFIQEFIQEFGQAAGQDVAARLLYDEKRKFDLTSWLEQGAVGGITGGLADAAVHAMHETGVSPHPKDAAPMTPDQKQIITQQVIDNIQTHLDNLTSEHDNAVAASVPLSTENQTGPYANIQFVQVAPQVVQGPGGTIPVNENGQFEAHHASGQQLETIDPAQRGTGPLRGRERNRLFGPDAVDRSYFGVGDPNFVRPKGQPYKLDTDPYHGEGLGPFRHTVEADPKTIYNWHEDPLNLKSQLDRSTPTSEQVTRYEKLIKDAGFKGFYMSESTLGQVAAMFEPTKPSRVVDQRYGLPPAEIATPQDFAAATPETFSKKGGWAVVTATQEAQGDASAPANIAANDKLRKELTKKGIPFQEVGGTYQGVDQGKSFLVFMPEKQAVALGKKYKQESVLTRKGLEYSDGRLVPAIPDQTVVGDKAKANDFYSTLPNGQAFSVGLDFGGGEGSDLLGMMLPNGDNTNRISTRFPQQAKSTEDPISDRLTVDTEAMKANPAAFKHNMELVAGYVNMPLSAKTETPDQIAEQFKSIIKDNLRWLYDQVPAAIRNRTKKWYDGARKITDEWSARYQLPDQSIAGVLAALSPQKDWYQNVSLAERVLDATAFKGAEPWSPEMDAKATSLFAKPAHQPLLEKVRGKTLDQIAAEFPDRYDLQALWVRTFDEAHNPRAFREVSSEGVFVGEPAGNVAWGSLVEIAKAIAVIRDPSYENVSPRMGDKHKVRNFFNNILAPNAPKGDVTIDTHAVAAALLRPLSGASTEVMHNFGSSPMKEKQAADWPGAAKSAGVSGASGTYGLYADAYRELADELGILPRELQSITWEAVRGMFAAKFKSAKNVTAVNDIWRRAREGDITDAQARDEIGKFAGGIKDPSWYRPGARGDEKGSPTSYARDVPADSVPEWASRADASGTDGGNTQGIAGTDVAADVFANVPAPPATAPTPQTTANADLERPQGGVPGDATGKLSDVNLIKIANTVSKLLDMTVRQGRLTIKGGAVGQYDRKQDVTRVRKMDDVATRVHEGGHDLYFNAGNELKMFVAANDVGLMKVADDLYGGDTNTMKKSTHIAEGFAEFFRVYTLNRAYAVRNYGTLVQDFDAVLDREAPKLKTGLAAIGEQYAAWMQMPSAQVIRNMIISGKQTGTINTALKELADAGFGTWMHEYARQAVGASLNMHASLNDLVAKALNIHQETKGKALDLKRSEDPRILQRLGANSGAAAMVQVSDGVNGYHSTKPFTRSLREALLRYHGKNADQNLFSIDKTRQEDFASYIVALRGIDEMRRRAEGKIKEMPLGPKVSLDEMSQTVAQMEGKYGTDFVEAAKIAHEYAMGLWQKSFDAGLMEEETYLDGLDRQFYVPLQRDMSDKKESFGSSALTGAGRYVKRFGGSGRNVIDPMDILMHKTFALEKIIARNEVFKALGLLADRAGKVGSLVERIPAKQLMSKQLSVKDVATALTKDETLTKADAQDLMEILQASITDDSVINLFRSETVQTKGENIVFGWENGKLAALQLADGELGADVMNTMNALGKENMPLFTGLLSSTSTLFRGSIVKWPDFLVANFIKDQFSAFIVTDVGFIPFVSSVKGMFDELRQTNIARQYNAAMGTMGGMNVANLHDAHVDRDISALKRQGYLAKAFSKNGIRGSLEGLTRIIELSETSTRLGVYGAAYKRAKRDGLTDWDASIEAAYLGTDLMDFGLHGSRMLLARRTIPFLNAQLQGLYKMMRTLGADEVRQRKGLRFVLGAYFKSTKNAELSRNEKQAINTGRKAWVKMASLGLISAALHFLFRDDPDYQNASEYLRTTGWVIPMGHGRLFYVPKPYELAVLANFTERALESADGDTEAMSRFMRGLAMVATPPMAPPLIKEIVETQLNRDAFTGKEIEPKNVQGLDPYLRFDTYTSTLAKQLGEITGLSPMMIDHVMSGLGASAYRDISSMYNATDRNRGNADATDMPFIRRFVRDASRGSTASQDFWNTASTTNGILNAAAVSYAALLKAGNTQAADQYLNGLDPDARAYAILNTDFKADAKRLNPWYRARQLAAITSAMRREMVTDLGLQDTTTKTSGQMQLTAREKTDLDNALSELTQRDMRNTLVVMKAPGWRGKRILDTEGTMSLIGTIDPRVLEELQRRVAKQKVYDFKTIVDYWPEVQNRLLADHENTFLDDIVSAAKVMQ